MKHSDSSPFKLSKDIYQTAADQLMTMFITKLEEIVKELEKCGGDLKMMKSELRRSLEKLESSLPAPLREKVTSKIKSPEMDHEKTMVDLDKMKKELHKNRQEKRQASQAAMDFFKIFLPDGWVTHLQERERLEQLESKKGTNKHGDTTKPASARPTIEAYIHEAGIEHEPQYQLAHSKLIGLYNARLENIRKAIEIAGGDVMRLDPSIKTEIKALQSVIPEGHLKMLNGFMEGKDKGVEVAIELEKSKDKIAKELAGVTINTVELSIFATLERSVAALGYRHEANLKHELPASKIKDDSAKSKSSGFTIADMDAFISKRMSGDNS